MTEEVLFGSFTAACSLSPEKGVSLSGSMFGARCLDLKPPRCAARSGAAVEIHHARGQGTQFVAPRCCQARVAQNTGAFAPADRRGPCDI